MPIELPKITKILLGLAGAVVLLAILGAISGPSQSPDEKWVEQSYEDYFEPRQIMDSEVELVVEGYFGDRLQDAGKYNAWDVYEAYDRSAVLEVGPDLQAEKDAFERWLAKLYRANCDFSNGYELQGCEKLVEATDLHGEYFAISLERENKAIDVLLVAKGREDLL